MTEELDQLSGKASGGKDKGQAKRKPLPPELPRGADPLRRRVSRAHQRPGELRRLQQRRERHRPRHRVASGVGWGPRAARASQDPCVPASANDYYFNSAVVVPDAGGLLELTVSQAKKPQEGRVIIRLSENPMTLRGWTVVDSRGGQVNISLSGLQAVRREVPNWTPDEQVPFVERRLAALSGTMAGVKRAVKCG